MANEQPQIGANRLLTVGGDTYGRGGSGTAESASNHSPAAGWVGESLFSTFFPQVFYPHLTEGPFLVPLKKTDHMAGERST